MSQLNEAYLDDIESPKDILRNRRNIVNMRRYIKDKGERYPKLKRRYLDKWLNIINLFAEKSSTSMSVVMKDVAEETGKTPNELISLLFKIYGQTVRWLERRKKESKSTVDDAVNELLK